MRNFIYGAFLAVSLLGASASATPGPCTPMSRQCMSMSHVGQLALAPETPFGCSAGGGTSLAVALIGLGLLARPRKHR